MAKGNRTGKGWFKKGIVTNPTGRPKMDPDLKAMKLRTRPEVEKAILKFYNYSEAQLNEVMKDPSLTLLEKHIARVILRGIGKGELVYLTALSDYVFGKQIEKVKMDMTSSDGSMNSQVVLYIPDNGFTEK